jgi:hypothetical protein
MNVVCQLFQTRFLKEKNGKNKGKKVVRQVLSAEE